jgi:hypothetical protein
MSKNTGTSELINYFDLGANGDVGIAGSLDVNTIANATTDTDKFLVSDTGIIKYRTGAELLTDIGAQGLLTNPVTGTGTTNYVPKFTGANTIGNSQIFDNGTQVGIGTTGPAVERKLTVAGGAQFTGGNTSGASFNIIPALNGQDGADFNLSYYTGSAYGPLNFIVGEFNRLRINPNGNLLVGTTTDAGFKLDVNGTGRFTSSVTATQFIASGGNNTTVFNSTSATTGWVQMGMNNTSGSALLGVENSSGGTLATGTSAYATVLRNYTNTDLQIATNNIVRTTITSGGNVGIGTTAPAAIISGNETTLNVKGASASNVGSIVARSFGTTNLTTIGLAAFDTINLTALYVESNSPLAIYTNATERMRITSGGNVLIGTTTSGASKLRIVGLPTSAAGLSSGDVWNDGGTLKIA